LSARDDDGTVSPASRFGFLLGVLGLAMAFGLAPACTLTGEGSDASESPVCPKPPRKFTGQSWASSAAIGDIAVHCNTIYIAGEDIGPRTGPLAAVSVTTGERLASLPALSGEVGDTDLADPLVRSMVSDGSGGWYVGGAFAFAWDRPCAGIVHVLRSGRLDPRFCPRTDGPVDSLARLNQTLYLGGDFVTVGGERRKQLAAVGTRDGEVLPWKPLLAPARYCPDRDEPGGLSLKVRTIATTPSAVFVGGFLAGAGGVSRPGLVALDPDDASILPFDAALEPEECGGPTVAAVLPTADGLVVAGDESYTPFLRVLDERSGSAVAPRLPGLRVSALASRRSTLFVGGIFGAAAFDLRSGMRLPWDPRVRGDVCCYNPAGGVHAIAAIGDTVYLGGNFARAGGEPHRFVVATDAVSGDVRPWRPEPNAPVLTIGPSGSKVVLGGTLMGVNMVERDGLIAIDGPTGRLLDWAPVVRGGAVGALHVAHGRLYVGGDFERVEGEPRRGLAAFDLDTKELTDWSPTTGNDIYGVTVLASSRDRIYAGGDFDVAASGPEDPTEPRAGVSAFDAESSEVLDWDPELRNGGDSVHVHAIAIVGDTVTLGGEFEVVADTPQEGVVAVDDARGEARQWNPAPANLGFVYALASTDSAAYLGGWFDTVGGERRQGLAQVLTADGTATSFDANLSGGNVEGIAMAGRRLFIVGDFDAVAGKPRAGVAALDAATGQLLPWNQAPADRARFNPSRIVVGGGAVLVNGYIQGNGEQLVVQPLAIG
jgi:hypothetical protein